MYTIVLLSQKIKLFDLTWLEYADDTYLIVCASKRATIMAELNHISTWAAQNNLRLNANKSREMLIQTSSNLSSLKPSCYILTVSDNIRATEVISSCSRGLYALRVLRSNGLSDISLHCVAKATVVARLLYIVLLPGGVLSRLKTGIRLKTWINRAILESDQRDGLLPRRLSCRLRDGSWSKGQINIGS